MTQKTDIKNTLNNRSFEKLIKNNLIKEVLLGKEIFYFFPVDGKTWDINNYRVSHNREFVIRGLIDSSSHKEQTLNTIIFCLDEIILEDKLVALDILSEICHLFENEDFTRIVSKNSYSKLKKSYDILINTRLSDFSIPDNYPYKINLVFMLVAKNLKKHPLNN